MVHACDSSDGWWIQKNLQDSSGSLAEITSVMFSCDTLHKKKGFVKKQLRKEIVTVSDLPFHLREYAFSHRYVHIYAAQVHTDT